MVDNIKNFIKDRPQFMFMLAFLLLCGAILALLQGCNLASLVSVDVPPAVQVATAIPVDNVSLANVDMVWDDWKTYVESNTNKFERAIDDANERYAVLNQVTDIGLKTLEGEVSGIPGGTILLSGLSLLTGLFLKRPGEDARVAKEKRDSYNKGIEVGATVKAEVKA
jgi:hypothetical protein